MKIRRPFTVNRNKAQYLFVVLIIIVLLLIVGFTSKGAEMAGKLLDKDPDILATQARGVLWIAVGAVFIGLATVAVGPIAIVAGLIGIALIAVGVMSFADAE